MGNSLIPLRRIVKLACSTFSLLAVFGCASSFLGVPISSAKLDGLGEPRVLLMQTQIIRGNDSYSMDMIVELSKDQLTVIGSSLGVRIFTLAYDGDKVVEGIGLGLPIYFPSRLIIDDVKLIISSKDSLKSGLSADCSLASQGSVERIYCGGHLAASIKKIQLNSGTVEVALDRFNPNYQLNVVMSEAK